MGCDIQAGGFSSRESLWLKRRRVLEIGFISAGKHVDIQPRLIMIYIINTLQSRKL